MKQRPGTMRAVIAPKVAAVQNFAHGSGGLTPLAFSLLCSSVSAIAGYSGQVLRPPPPPHPSPLVSPPVAHALLMCACHTQGRLR